MLITVRPISTKHTTYSYLKFLHSFLYSSKKKKLKNLLVRTKFYWSLARGSVLITMTIYIYFFFFRIENLVMPQYSRNTAKVGIKHQSINRKSC